MDKLDDGELIIYSDVGDMFHPELFPYVEDLMGPDDPCLLLIGGFPQKLLTKRDCFVYMDCDEEDYWECFSTRRWNEVLEKHTRGKKDCELNGWSF